MYKTKHLTEIAITIALTMVCRFIKIWEMPQGGSISLAMVPIIFISFRRGVVSGISAGVIYGLLDAMFFGPILHPLSLLLDYIFAFGVLGIAGVFRKSDFGIICGCIAATGGRFLFSLLSGAVLFADYAPAGQNPWVYSLIYQASYMLPELLIVIVVLMFLYKKFPKLF